MSISNPLGLRDVTRTVNDQFKSFVTQEKVGKAVRDHTPLWKKQGFFTSSWAISSYIALIMFIMMLIINPPWMRSNTVQIVNGKKQYTTDKHISLLKLTFMTLGLWSLSITCFWLFERGETINLKTQLSGKSSDKPSMTNRIERRKSPGMIQASRPTTNKIDGESSPDGSDQMQNSERTE